MFNVEVRGQCEHCGTRMEFQEQDQHLVRYGKDGKPRLVRLYCYCGREHVIRVESRDPEDPDDDEKEDEAQ